MAKDTNDDPNDDRNGGPAIETEQVRGVADQGDEFDGDGDDEDMDMDMDEDEDEGEDEGSSTF